MFLSGQYINWSHYPWEIWLIPIQINKRDSSWYWVRCGSESQQPHLVEGGFRAVMRKFTQENYWEKERNKSKTLNRVKKSLKGRSGGWFWQESKRESFSRCCHPFLVWNFHCKSYPLGFYKKKKQWGRGRILSSEGQLLKKKRDLPSHSWKAFPPLPVSNSWNNWRLLGCHLGRGLGKQEGIDPEEAWKKLTIAQTQWGPWKERCVLSCRPVLSTWKSWDIVTEGRWPWERNQNEIKCDDVEDLFSPWEFKGLALLIKIKIATHCDEQGGGVCASGEQRSAGPIRGEGKSFTGCCEWEVKGEGEGCLKRIFRIIYCVWFVKTLFLIYESCIGITSFTQ